MCVFKKDIKGRQCEVWAVIFCLSLFESLVCIGRVYVWKFDLLFFIANFGEEIREVVCGEDAFEVWFECIE